MLQYVLMQSTSQNPVFYFKDATERCQPKSSKRIGSEFLLVCCVSAVASHTLALCRAIHFSLFFPPIRSSSYKRSSVPPCSPLKCSIRKAQRNQPERAEYNVLKLGANRKKKCQSGCTPRFGVSVWGGIVASILNSGGPVTSLERGKRRKFLLWDEQRLPSYCCGTRRLNYKPAVFKSQHVSVSCSKQLPARRRRHLPAFARTSHFVTDSRFPERLGLARCCNIDLRPHKASLALYITPHSAVIYSIKSNITLLSTQLSNSI